MPTKEDRTLDDCNMGEMHIPVATVSPNVSMCPPPTESPNVVLLLTDDQGYGDLSCHGNPTVRTPHMDRLHEEAARLENFHVSTTCAPTRASLLTGRHKLRTGVWHTINGRSLLHRAETTLAEVFRRAGYRSGIFGKWHLGDNYPYRPQDRGFDTGLIHGGGGVAQTPDYWGNDYFDDTYFRDGEVPEPADGYCTDVWFDEAIAFIESCVIADEPFFCYLPTNAPHAPTQVPAEYLEQYAGDVPERLARFFGMVTNIDDNLGRLRERLDALEIAGDTIIMFMGDNGTAGDVNHFNAGMRGGKGSQYDGGHRVQSFIHWPEVIEDITVTPLTRHYDILPTLVDLCGLERPDAELDGDSLRPLLFDEAVAWPDRWMVVDTQRVDRPQKWRRCAVMTERWRLVDGEELYDIREDRGQTNDISGSQPAVVAALRDHYEGWWESVSTRFDQYCRIVLGNDAENPSTLTAHDWHGSGRTPWNQVTVLSGIEDNGYWTVEFDVAGTYEIELRRWPKECDTAIDSIPDGFETMRYGVEDGWSGEGYTIDPAAARLRIGKIKRSKPVPDGAVSVVFELDLPAGPAELSTRFVEPSGAERGAYYVYCERKRKCAPEKRDGSGTPETTMTGVPRK